MLSGGTMFGIYLLLACTSGSEDCLEDSPVDSSSPYSVTLSFWPSSELDGSDEVPTTEPRTELNFTWNDPSECFVWIRSVAESIGGGERTNVASDFVLDTSNPDEIQLTYIQNSSSCCSEFATPGTEKTFYSNIVIIDETTGQTGDPLYVAVTDYRAP